MKKISTSLLKIFIATAVVAIIFLTIKYCELLKHNTYPNKFEESYLTPINSAVQIGYNIVCLIIAIVVLFVAYFQLSKTREATTIQTLINIDNYIRAAEFSEKRKKLANLILSNKIGNFSAWLTKIKNTRILSPSEIELLANVKNTFEAVIYQFELIGHFYKKNIFSIEDVYQLFSIEIQNYWVLMRTTGYIEYLRCNKHNPNIDFYDNFENLFNDIVIQEAINHSPNCITKYLLKFYYWTNCYRLFYRGDYYLFYPKRHNMIKDRIAGCSKEISIFLAEEHNLT